MSDEPEQGATGRRFSVSVVLVLCGAALMLYGLIERQWIVFLVGTVLAIIFGLTAAGMERGEASVGPIKVKTDFTTSPPPAIPLESEEDAATDATTRVP